MRHAGRSSPRRVGYIRRAGPSAALHPAPHRPLFQELLNAAVNTELDQIWGLIQAELAAAVEEPTYRIWLAPLKLRDLTASGLVVEASPQAGAWIRERFGRLLQSCAATALGQELPVAVVSSTTAAGIPAPGADSPPAVGTAQATPLLGNPRHTFNQFV